MARILTKLAGTVVVLTLLALAAGATYNSLSVRKLKAEAHTPGQLYAVNGHDMHMMCMGTGSPTLVLDTGLGDDFTTWLKVQPALAKVTRVCSYDRSGFGSSAMTPGAHDADTLSAQLHALVGAADIEKPFILMGHSIAGLYLRSYAQHYQGDLSALVFVDGATPLQDDRVPKSLVAIQDQQRREMPWQKFLMTVGWYRLHGDCDSVAPGFEAYAAIIRANNCAPSQFDALEAELDAERQSGEETVHVGPFPRLPILVFSRDPASMPSNWPPEVAKANSVVWNQMQEESKRLSPLSRRVIAKGSDHYVHVDRPDLVIREVTALIESVRRGEVSYRQDQPTVTE
ncbi:alpha/beta hydrolase [Luteibacter pinisoli]|uniref:Alpha/beta hydrolase n=1 Tax=Luteibacter pinisoli TaxID=2589080 RepID=A0A4Y5Z274_9GAMM|nr:alpha/beta hydrolase [Luteibacter pinisoli]QDE39440.1 alpha/beta hydrolase [Luteibacter pinisoli]